MKRALLLLAALVCASVCAPAEEPLANPVAKYQQWLDTLPKTDMNSIRTAVDRYKADFAKESQETRDAGFLAFRCFYREAVRTIGDRFDSKNLSGMVDDPKFAQEMKSNGLATMYAAMLCLCEEPGYLIDECGGLISEPIRVFQWMADREVTETEIDHGIAQPPETMGERSIQWENYVRDFPRSPFVREAMQQHKNYLSSLLYGLCFDLVLDNRWKEGEDLDTSREEIESAYQNLIARYPETRTGKLLAQYYPLIKQSGFKEDDTIKHFLKEALGPLAFAIVPDTPGADAPPAVGVAYGILTLSRQGVQILVRLDEPRFVFESAVLEPLPSNSANLSQKDLLSGRVVELSCPIRKLPNETEVETILCLQWSEKESVLRKWARYRLDKPEHRLDEVVLESVNVYNFYIGCGSADIQSQPAFESGAFYGIEFPVATVREEGGRLLLAHRPGIAVEPGVWHETRKAVFGLSAPGQEKEAFRRYIMAHRVPPGGLHIDYNSWWTSPVPYTEKDILDLMQTFETQFFKPFGGRFDSFCIDMGWSNAKALWEIDPNLFPDGFTHIQQAAKKMESQLGLWISPSAVYPPALDVPWAKSQGYEGQKDGLCLGGPRYQADFSRQLAKMIDEYHVQQFKFDGYRITCPESDHGHVPGPLSAEPIAEGIILAANTIREHSKEAWIEPTCFGWNPSPWWLFYFNSVIGSFGDDAPYGRVPAPVHRESYTTARDFFNLQGAYWNPIPPAAQEVLGIIHQTDEPFMNDAVMTILRGHRFLPLYVNPKFMNEARWKSLAETLKWARKHVPDFEETHPLLPASWQGGQCPRFTSDAAMPREPYGYAHRMQDGTMVALRNPWIVPQPYVLTLDAASGFADTGKPFNAVSLYPEPRVYAREVPFGGQVLVTLAPYETAVIEFGASSPTKAASLPPHSKYIEIVSAAPPCLDTFAFDDSLPALGPDWTGLAGNASGATQLTLDTEVVIESPQATLLILLDGAPNALSATARVDGKDASLRATGSSTGWSATGAPKPEIWTFLDAPLHSGKKHIEAEVLFAGKGVKVSAWIWATRPGTTDTLNGELPEPEMVSIGSSPLLEPTEAPPASAQKRPRPVERINGVFLDTLTPQSATAGWGTVRMNQSVWEKPMTIGGKIYPRGIGTHAPSRIVYPLDKQYKRFQAQAGADGATAPTVTFEVWVDGTKRWESGLMTRDMPAKSIDLDIAGAATLELVVGDGGNGLGADHADWAEARLLR